jgi:hypothetical protein
VRRRASNVWVQKFLHLHAFVHLQIAERCLKDVGLCQTPLKTPPKASRDNLTHEEIMPNLNAILVAQTTQSSIQPERMPCPARNTILAFDLQHSVVELSASASAHSIQIFVALDRATLCRLHRAWSTVTEALHTGSSTPWWRCQTSVGTIGSGATISVLSIVRASSVVIEATAASSHWSSLSIIMGSVRVPVAHGRIEHAVLHTIAGHTHVHAGQVETTWCAGSLHMISHGKVAVAVGIASGRCDMGRIDNVRVDKSELYVVSIAIS